MSEPGSAGPPYDGDAPVDADVIVIGAGLAGLIAARELVAADRSVLLLEARDRLGGRLFARSLKSRPVVVDFGGTWIIPEDHAHVVGELARYGLARIRTPDPDRYLTWVDGQASDRRRLDDAELATLQIVLDRVADSSTPESDFDTELARAAAPALLRDWLQALNRYLNGCDLVEVSAQVMSGYPADVFEHPDHYSDQVAGTTQSLVDAVAADVDAVVRLETAVSAVRRAGDRVLVHDDAGHVYHSRAAVIAVPFNTMAEIDFDPPIEGVPRRGERHPGHSVKLWITARHVSGVPRLFDVSGPLVYLRLERRLADGEALLVAFGCDPALQTASEAEVQAMLETSLPDIEVTSVDTHDWNADPWAQGTWLAPGPSQDGRIAALAAHDGPIRFAGGDLSQREPGTIEGAIESGKAVADEVDAFLT